MAPITGYKYRKKKNLTCNAILGHLYEVQTLNRENNTVVLEEFAKIKEFDRFLVDPLHGWRLLVDCCRLLKNDGYVDYEEDKEDFSKGTVLINQDGEEAFKDSYYLIRKRKDNQQRWKLATEWFIPLITFTLSGVALFISLYINRTSKVSTISTSPHPITIKDSQKSVGKKIDSLVAPQIQKGNALPNK